MGVGGLFVFGDSESVKISGARPYVEFVSG